MPATETRRAADRFTTALARLVAGLFFRRVEVVGAERVPRDRPLLVVANHVNSLVDPVLILGFLPRSPRFLGKHTLWKKATLRPFLALGGVIPVYRRQDAGPDPGSPARTSPDPSRNLETFARCHEELARGGSICLFPEGISHNFPDLAPLKTGAARIVLGAEETHGPLGVRILPVGLFFDAKGRFRSRALLQVGDPLDPGEEAELHRREPETAVRRLTARVERALRAVTLNFGSWEEARQIALAAEIYSRPRLALPEAQDLADAFGLRRAFLEGYEKIRTRYPEETAEAAGEVEGYAALLEAGGLRDAHVAAAYPAVPVLRFLWRSALFLLLALPLAVAGTVLNYLPYRLAGWIAARFGGEPDVEATYKLFSSVFLFPLTWLGEALIALGWGGGWAALATALLAPTSALAALHVHERLRLLRQEARAFLLLRTRERFARRLAARREAALRRISALVERYGSSG